MSKAIFVCYKNQSPTNLSLTLELICNELEPDNIIARKPLIFIEKNEGFGICNPPKNLETRGTSFFLGNIFNTYPKWNIPNSQIPDGTFALFRSDEKSIEICSDVLATRTVWYYFDEDKFIASTSQRAIIMLLGDFCFNKAVIPWMISNGTLGYSNSWDHRIKKIEADSNLILNRSKWEVKINQNPFLFNKKNKSKKEFENELLKIISSSIKSLNISFDDWSLPLSGGYDSRAILLFNHFNQKSFSNLKTFTWGLNRTRFLEGTDGFISEKLAKNYGVHNEYLSTDFEENNVEILIDRFFKMGEGRISHISGYLDGFNLWKKIFNYGCNGILRGDEGFGWSHLGFFPKSNSIRKSVNCYLVKDYSNLIKFARHESLVQNFPDELRKQNGEKPEDYRDRLYQQFRVSTVLSALADLKLSYVEISNPLISKIIINEVRSLPPKLRTEKILFKEIVDKLSPDIEFAKFDSIADENKIFRNKQFVDIFTNELKSNDIDGVFPIELINYVLNNLTINKDAGNITKLSLRKRIIKSLPNPLKETLKSIKDQKFLNVNQLAFRMITIIRMKKLLFQDSKRFLD